MNILFCGYTHRPFHIRKIFSVTESNLCVILSGICGLILSEILLLWVLWKPTRRLHQLAKALPLLAVHDYSQAKQIISKANRSLLQDELDLLEQTALTVSCELEQMQTKVVTHARQLELQMSEQVRARQFMAQLLDTAPLIIITDGEDNRSRYTFSEVEQFAKESDVHIYVIGEWESWATGPVSSLRSPV